MGLNIKNERVHDLAKRAARVTGKTQTGAIEEALLRLLEAYGADPEQERVATKIDLVHAIVERYQQAPGSAGRAIRTVEDLYDEAAGMPR